MRHVASVALLAAAILALAAAPACATSSLYKSDFNVNGTVYSGTSLPSMFDASGFNSITGLGTVRLTYDPNVAGSYVALGFFDHDIGINTFFNEFGATGGSPAAGQSWEIDEPGYIYGDIVTNFTNGTLDNTNAVPSTFPDDVSMALGWDWTMALGEQAVIDWTVSTAPPAGFYLSHTDPDSQETLYLSSVLDIQQDDTLAIPEPVTMVGCLMGIGGLTAYARKRRRG